MLDVLGLKDANKLVPMPDDQKPRDPISENMAAFKMEPLKAFIYQDHQAHITVHMSAMQDPKIMQMMGQNPNAQMIIGAMMAHIQEHVGYEYRRQMEEMIGVPIPYSEEDDYDMPEEVELQIARLAAPAAQKLLQMSQSQVAQQQAQQNAQDPLIQIQQQELAIKQQDAATKQQKVQIDAQAKAEQLRIEQERIASQERIAVMQNTAKVEKDRTQLQMQDEIEYAKLAVDISKSEQQMSNQKEKPTKGN
jgi:hypothetical protein